MLESVNNEKAIPRINSRQTKRINIKTNDPEEYFRISILYTSIRRLYTTTK